MSAARWSVRQTDNNSRQQELAMRAEASISRGENGSLPPHFGQTRHEFMTGLPVVEIPNWPSSRHADGGLLLGDLCDESREGCSLLKQCVRNDITASHCDTR